MHCVSARLLLRFRILASFGFIIAITSQISFSQTKVVPSSQARRAYAAARTNSSGANSTAKWLTTGALDDVLVLQDVAITWDTAKDMLASEDIRKNAASDYFPIGFKRFVVSNAKVELGSATVTSTGFSEVKISQDPRDRHLDPSEALSAAHSELAKGGGLCGPKPAGNGTSAGSGAGCAPKLVYEFSCQIPPNAPEYAEAQQIIKANDTDVRRMGLLNDFFEPLHMVCDKIGRGLVSPIAISEVQPTHFAQQDATRLSQEAKATGSDVTFKYLCLPKGSCGLTGTFNGEDSAPYSRSLFADMQVAKQLSVLGYSFVLVLNTTNPSKPQLLWMKPTRNGWVALPPFPTEEQSADDSSQGQVTLNPKFHLTKAYDDQQVTIRYPDTWEVTAANERVVVIGPHSDENIVTLSNGKKWTIEGIKLIYVFKITDLPSFKNVIVAAVSKDDLNLKWITGTTKSVSGHPSISEDYTTSSDVDSHHEVGTYLFTNSRFGTIIAQIYCDAEHRNECTPLLDEILTGITVK